MSLERALLCLPNGGEVTKVPCHSGRLGGNDPLKLAENVPSQVPGIHREMSH